MSAHRFLSVARALVAGAIPLTVLCACGPSEVPGCHCAQVESFDTVGANTAVCAGRDASADGISPCNLLLERHADGTTTAAGDFVVTGRTCTADETQRGCASATYSYITRGGPCPPPDLAAA